MQFQGPSKRPFFHRAEVQKGELGLRELGGTFNNKGIFIWPNGRKQDSAEAIREYLGGKEIEYPKARYDEYVVMHSNEYPWSPLDGASGVAVRHLGYFNEVGRISKWSKSTPAPARCRVRRHVSRCATLSKAKSLLGKILSRNFVHVIFQRIFPIR